MEEGRGPNLFLLSSSQPCENWHSPTSGVLRVKECALMNLSLPEVCLREHEKPSDIQRTKTPLPAFLGALQDGGRRPLQSGGWNRLACLSVYLAGRSERATSAERAMCRHESTQSNWALRFLRNGERLLFLPPHGPKLPKKAEESTQGGEGWSGQRKPSPPILRDSYHRSFSPRFQSLDSPLLSSNF